MRKPCGVKFEIDVFDRGVDPGVFTTLRRSCAFGDDFGEFRIDPDLKRLAFQRAKKAFRRARFFKLQDAANLRQHPDDGVVPARSRHRKIAERIGFQKLVRIDPE
jgi:hypothetical protein